MRPETFVPQKDDPVPERSRLDEAEQDLLVRRKKKAVAIADLNRVNVNPVLVDEVLRHEGRSQLPTADDEIPFGLELECLDLLPHDVACNRGVPPRRSERL